MGSLQQKNGYMVRSMRMIPTNKVSTKTFQSTRPRRKFFTDLWRAEWKAMTIFLSLRTEPLRCVIHCRNVATQIRMYWKAPRSTVGKFFDDIDKSAARVK